MLPIAAIVKPQGIKGEVKVKCFLDKYADLSSIKTVIIQDAPIVVEKIRSIGDFVYIKLKGVDDRNAAEALRGQTVFADENNRPRLAKGRYYIKDIQGCKLIAAGKELGVVAEVIQNGGADVYRIEGDKPFLFALVDGVITKFDIAAKQLIADETELQKVAVYED